MTEKLAAKGIMLDKHVWDDKADHDDVKKIYVCLDNKGVQYIYFDYVKSGIPREGSCHFNKYSGLIQMFEIKYQRNEHLESVDGYYNESVGIQALQFYTNYKTSELMGSNEKCTKFTLAVKGKKVTGFHGSAHETVYSLGAYFSSIPPIRLDEKGGKGGIEWDDGGDHDDVSKIHVRGGSKGIQFIRFDYVKDGQIKNGSIHGISDRGGYTQTDEINHREGEYVVSVEGYYDDVSGVIQGIQFKTNMQIFDMIGYDNGRKFTLAANGNKMIGFHGYAEKSINSLGVYFTPHTPNKLECHGETKGFLWDDGSNNDGIRKVCVYAGSSCIWSIRFEYVNGGKVEKTHRRVFSANEEEFVLDYPNELITSVEGITADNVKWLSSLTFKTSKGRTSPTYGSKSKDDGKKFLLEKKGNALVGFYGWTQGVTQYALGAYYRPLPPLPDVNKLEAQGGDGGACWDDGGFDGVRRIYIGISKTAVSFIKFMYCRNDQLVFGEDHGNKTKDGVQEFEVNFPSEYITSVEGTYDTKSGVITMLRFYTNIQTSPIFGQATTSSFIVGKNDHKIVGFHGKSGHMLHQIGALVIPI